MGELMVRVEQVFRDAFADPRLTLARGMTASDVDGWDSVAHVNLLVALERAFQVRFTTAEMARLSADGQTVGDLVDLLETKAGGEQQAGGAC